MQINQVRLCDRNFLPQNNSRNQSNVIFRGDIFARKALEEALRNSEAKNVLLEKYTGALEELLKRISSVNLGAGAEVLTNIATDFRKQLATIIPVAGTLAVTNGMDEYQNEVLQRINSPLGYDPMAPVFVKFNKAERTYKKEFEYIEQAKPTSIPKEAKTTEDYILELDKNGSVVLRFDAGDKKSIVRNEDAYIDSSVEDLGKVTKTETTARYGRRVDWKNEKIARDLLQNFYDAHGHTLDGTVIKVSKKGDKYTVRVEGLVEYGYENIKYMGSGDKEFDLYNAGGFGEGSKILSAVMLGNGLADKVRFSSANWLMEYGVSEEDLEKAIITRKLDKLFLPTKGNYVEFETKSKDLVEKVINARNYFYHQQNPDFKDLTYENDEWGFKVLPKGEKGNLYLTQRFEYDTSGNWDESIKSASLIMKRKSTNFDVDGKNRDRISLRNTEIRSMLRNDFVKTMSDEELMDAILKTEVLWNYTTGYPSSFDLSNDIIEVLLKEAYFRNLKLNINKKVASLHGFVPEDIKDRVKGMGYELVNGDLYYLGVPSAGDIYKETRLHKPLMPTEVEKRKLVLLEEAITLLAENPKMQSRIDLEDAKKPRFIYDSKDCGEEQVQAEAIIENKKYLGHWVDRRFLAEASFYDAIATWLHEITHKYGGDGTKIFGYKLTDVMGLELESLMSDPEKLEKLRFLKSEYEKL